MLLVYILLHSLKECNSTLEDSSIDSDSTTGKDCTSNDTCCSTNGTSKEPVKCFVLHCVRGTVDTRQNLSEALN